MLQIGVARRQVDGRDAALVHCLVERLADVGIFGITEHHDGNMGSKFLDRMKLLDQRRIAIARAEQHQIEITGVDEDVGPTVRLENDRGGVLEVLQNGPKRVGVSGVRMNDEGSEHAARSPASGGRPPPVQKTPLLPGSSRQTHSPWEMSAVMARE